MGDANKRLVGTPRRGVRPSLQRLWRGRRPRPTGLAVVLVFWLMAGGWADAFTVYNDSHTFSLDSRDPTGTTYGDSATFSLDTRGNEGLMAFATSASFELDTRGVLTVWSQTLREATTFEIRNPVPPPPPSRLKVLVGGEFKDKAAYPLNPLRPTIVLTHGWLSSPEAWALGMATAIQNRIGPTAANIVTWDWRTDAATGYCNPDEAARQSQANGEALAEVLFAELGANYDGWLHFIGHSMGTLLNARAVDTLDARPDKGALAWLPAKIHLTLFDEAEIGLDVTCAKLLGQKFSEWCGEFKNKTFRPLPKRFGWADNYITAFGLPQEGAVNVVLTQGFPQSPTGVLDLIGFFGELQPYHSYAMSWYMGTIQNPASSIMGYTNSFEAGRIPPFPPTNQMYFQDSSGVLIEANLDNWLAERCQKYLAFAAKTSNPNSLYVTTPALPSSMTVNRWSPSFEFGTTSWKFIFSPTSGGQQMQQQGMFSVQDLTATSDTNAANAAWIPLDVPLGAQTMRFDFMLEGDGVEDHFAAALNGTNVFAVAISQVQTGVVLNTGLIDVSSFAGQTVELFLGVTGGTSSNVVLTVQDIVFQIPLPPEPSFTASPRAGPPSLMVDFSDSSVGMITNWFWTFGDGTTLNQLYGDAAHLYDTAGVFTATLVVQGPTGSGTNTIISAITVWTPFQTWLDSYGLPTDGSADHLDSDDDNQSNFAEFVAGTNPLDSSSLLRITSIARTGSNITLQWLSSAGRLYHIQRTTNLNWNVALTLTNNIAATPATNTFTDVTATNGPAYFYRVGTGE